MRLDTSLKPVDFVAQRIDVGVRYGGASGQGWRQKLMDEEVYPVLRPALLATATLQAPGDLRGQVLIHDQSVDTSTGLPAGRPGCAMRGAGCPPTGACASTTRPPCCRRPLIKGVALARSVMAHDDLAAGRLVRLFPQVRLESALAYYVVYRPECIAQPKGGRVSGLAAAGGAWPA